MGWLDSIGDAFSDAASAVGGAVEDAAGAVGHAAEDAASGVAGFAGDAFSVLKTGVEDVGGFAETAASDVADGVEDAAKATGSFFKKAAKAVGGAVEDAASGVWNGIKDIGGGLLGGFEDFASGLVGGIGGFISNIAKGNVGDAFESLIQGLDKAVLQAGAKVFNGVVTGVQDAVDGVSHLLGPLGGPIRSVADRVLDIGRTIGNTAIELGRDAYRTVAETALGFGRGIVQSANDLIHGKFSDAAQDFGMAFVNAGKRLVGGGADAILRIAQGAVNVVQTATYLAPPSRPLNDQEKAVLRQVYGDSVDLDSMRIVVGGPLNADINGRARTIGNTVYMPSGFEKDGLIDPKTGGLNADGLTLVHETCHVWQSQTGGGDYISQALWGQEVDEGYNYQVGINEGKSFQQLNPEQQAEYVEEVLAPTIEAPGPGSAEDKLRANLSGFQLEYALDALKDLRTGYGAASN